MLLQDLRYALRTLRLNPVFTLVAVVCLAMAIGLNTMIFSVINGILIQPLPFADPDRLTWINETNSALGITESSSSYPTIQDWRTRSRSFSTITAFTNRSFALADQGGEPQRYNGAAISWEVFSMLGVAPALGRDLVADDDRLGAEPVVLLGDEIWRTRYAASRSVIGKPVSINGKPHTIVGVMPAGFAFPTFQKLWVPLAPLAGEDPRDRRGLAVVGRLRPEVTLEAARDEMRAIASALAREYPATHDRWSATVRPLTDEYVPADVRLILWTMMGAVMLVLVVACANVANLMLARAAARRREISIRAAIGAGRARIARQLLTEAMVLACLAVPPGLVIAYVGNDLMQRAIPPDDIPYTIKWGIDTAVLLYSVGIALLTGLLFGMAPAWQTRRLNLQSALKEGGRGTGGVGPRARLRSALVICEVAVSLVLLVGAALFVRSFLNMRDASTGFDDHRLMTMRLYMTGDTYAQEDARARRIDDVMQAVEAVPGVEAAFASNLIPLEGGGGGARIVVEGHATPAGEEPFIGFVGVTPHLIATLGARLMRGRDFTDAEGRQRQPVAVINETMAARFWPNADPVGRQFRLKDSPITETFTVIGVVRDFRHEEVEPGDEASVQAYVPYPYSATPNTGLSIRVAAGDPASITGAVRDAIRKVDPGIPLFSVQTMDEVRRRGAWQYELFGWLFSSFGIVALLLAVTGVYGLLSYAVSQRTQEIGVRVALGAARGDVVRLIVGYGLRLALLGIAVGIVMAFGVTRVIASMLYNITATDPVTFIGASLFLIALAAFASFVPTRRAVAVDPLVALRSE